MPIHSFIIQPVVNSLLVAYRPIVLRVEATATGGTPQPPIVYCDVYFGNVYYKTFSHTQPDIALNANNRSEWQFDIKDALQEYLKKFLAANGDNQINDAVGSMASIYCRFRSSGYDAGGFIVAENVAPVQGTGGTDPVAGTGTQCNTFFGLNASLQHEDNQQADIHLSNFKNGQWASNAWPMTHRSKTRYRVCAIGSDFYPFVYTGNKNITCLKLFYRYRGAGVYTNVLNCALGCDLAIDTIDLFFVDIIDGQAYFHAFWTMGTYAPDPFYYIFEYNDGTGTGWLAPVPDDQQINESFYYLPAKVAHDLRITPICANGVRGTPLTGHYAPAGGGCDPVTIIGAPLIIPDATAGYAYSYVFSLGGDGPIVMNIVTKPAWMTITLVGSTVTMSGNPDAGDVGVIGDVEVEFTNCAGGNTVTLTADVEVQDGLVLDDNVTVINNSNALSITAATPVISFHHITFPITHGNTALGFLDAFNGILWVTITGFDFAARLVLKVNGVFVECKPVAAAGTFYFTSRAYLAGDVIEIKLEIGDC